MISLLVSASSPGYRPCRGSPYCRYVQPAVSDVGIAGIAAGWAMQAPLTGLSSSPEILRQKATEIYSDTQVGKSGIRERVVHN